ncbi:type IV secretion system protein VirB6/type IV secretion system protein TrbL [Nitrosospira sp. Nsp11]|nr:type IV secretion system protein VirB6/type IV secretion system protein TrbL [Nitrosospira sp. Nsp11]
MLSVFFCTVLFVSEAHAAIENANVLDDILFRYKGAASAWAATITDRASWLFWLLVVISMVWTFGLMAVRRADLGEFFAEFIRFTVFTGFFWWLLIICSKMVPFCYTEMDNANMLFFLSS